MAKQPTGKVIHGTKEQFAVRDDQAVSVFIDAITEARINEGVFYLSLAQSIRDGKNPLEIDVQVRLRMTCEMAESIHATLGRQLEAARKPKPN